MYEQILNIPAFDGKEIYCCYNSANETPSEKAVILAHGITGQPNEYIHMAARDYFLERGYDVYRMAFYWSGNNHRILRDCTLDIHAKDMNAVVEYAFKSHEKVFVCGHSYGGMTMLFANPQATAISFWDSSYASESSLWEPRAEYLPELDCYTFGFGSIHLIGKAMYEEGKTVTFDLSEKLTKKISRPASVIMAEHGNHERSKILYENLQVEKELHVIKDADHCFTVKNTVQDLLLHTHAWFEKF